MADESEDQWLYGDSVEEKDSNSCQPTENNISFNQDESSFQQNEDAQDGMDEHPPGVDENYEEADNADETMPAENYQGENDQESRIQDEDSMTNDTRENGTNDSQALEDGDGGSSSESEDDVNVVIGDIKSTPAAQQYGSLNIKRGALITTTGGTAEKTKTQPGKFNIDEFESIGSINGIPAHEYNLDTLEDKPWRQPGADITDYFNYGFNEDTWRAYCERQKRMRAESGAGLVLNTNAGPPGALPGAPGARVPAVTITNYNSKYSGISGPKRAGPPPGRKMAGTIDVIGSTGLNSRRNAEKSPPKENVIQVMTADRREYSRKQQSAGGFPDMSVPPPPGPTPIPTTFDMPPPGYPEPVPYFLPEPDPYYHSYEPTQDRQWGGDPAWQPANVNIPLTGMDPKDHSKSMVPPPMSSMRDGRDRDRDRERDRDRDRDRIRDREREYEDRGSIVRDRERDRERDHEREREKESRREERHKESRHRHRSRSRSRRHKSRSRSPSKRKKKSRRSERERSKEESE